MENGRTPLIVAAYEGHAAVVAALLAAGAAVDQATEGGATPLFKAAHRGHAAMVAALLAAGAAVDQAMGDGCTPLIVAAQQGHATLVAALLAAGAAVNRKTQWGDTALTQAQGEEVTDVLADHVAFIASVAADPGVLVRGFVVALHFGAAAGGAGAASATHEAPPPHCTIKAPLRWAPPAARAAVLALAQDMAASQLAAALCLCLAASRTTAGHSLVEVLGPDPASLVASFLQPSSPEARAAVRAMARLHA